MKTVEKFGKNENNIFCLFFKTQLHYELFDNFYKFSNNFDYFLTETEFSLITDNFLHQNTTGKFGKKEYIYKW